MILIDRNGEHFQYCLDDLRDASIDLPMTVSEKAVLLEDIWD